MVFTDELKQLINADDTQKKVILSFPNSDIEDITNSQIYSESMSLEESLIEQSDIKFGKCNASVFKIRVANIDANLEGLDLSVSITFSNASLGLEQNIPIGVYKIRTAERSADRKWKDIVAYDYMTKFDVDIADWYNTVAFPTDDTKVLCKTLIAMLCDYVGVSYDTNYNFTFGDLEISKNILPTSLSGRDFLQQLLEFNSCFGHFNELGVLSFIDIEYDYAEYVYPSDDIFPSDDFLGGIQGMRADEVISLYKSCNFEEYQVIQPDSVAIKMEDDSIGVVVGSELGDRTYSVIGNSCLYGLSANELRTVATTMLNRLEQFYYTPNVTEVKGGLFLTLGSAYQVKHKFGNFQSYVLRRTIKGIQALYSTLESNAVDYATETSNIITEMSVIKGKTAKVKRDIDSLTVEYQDFTEQTRTQFEQSAEQFSWLVADNFSESNVMLSADAYTAIANNIVLQGNHIILDGDTTVTEGFTLTADNLDVNSIFAEDITATGTITGATLTGASGNFTKDFTVDVTTEKVLDDWDTSVIGSDYYIYMATDGNEITYANESDTYVDFYNLCVEYGGKIAWVDTSTGRVTIPYRIMWDVPEDYTTPAGVNLTWAHYINLSATTVVTGYNKILINEDELAIRRKSYPDSNSIECGLEFGDVDGKAYSSLYAGGASIKFTAQSQDAYSNIDIVIDGANTLQLNGDTGILMDSGATLNTVYSPNAIFCSGQYDNGDYFQFAPVGDGYFEVKLGNNKLSFNKTGYLTYGSALLSSDGNMYMPWASDWLSNVLGGKADLNSATFGVVFSQNWFRSYGATGWYNETYGGGIYMHEPNYITIYGGKGLYVGCGWTMNAGAYMASSIIIDATNITSNSNARPSIGFHLPGAYGASLFLSNQYNFRYVDNTGTMYTLATTSSSDRRKKNDYGLLSDEEATILLEGIDIHSFSYINDKECITHYGAMAQDVRDLLLNNCLGYRPFLEINHYENGRENGAELTTDLFVPESEVEYNMDYTKLIPVILKGWQMHEDKLNKILENINKLLGGNENA